MDQLTRIDQKLDKILDKQSEQSSILAVHTSRLDTIDNNLAEHMKRTRLLEDRMDKVELPVKAGKLLVAVCAGFLTIMAVVKLIVGA